MIRRILLYFILLIIFQAVVNGQEVLTGLQSNYSVTGNKIRESINKGVSAADTIELPFFDDFSGKSVFPDQRRWSDNSVFINNTYSDSQTTLGVATFDALNNLGKLYETASASGFKADQLTSKPINLSIPSSQNIWLSFQYQAGGLSDPPEKNDSLILQFFAPAEDKWYSVWRAEGETEKSFKSVIIPLTQSRYLRKGFRFRFTNYASTSPNISDPSIVANCDIWNVDYILLNSNRNQADTVFADVSYRLPIRSLLKNHEAMPWKQFRQVYLQEMGSSILVHYRNNDVITRNVTRNFEIWDVYKNSQAHFFSPGATNINPLTSVDYNANLVYTFNSDNTDSALFRITCSLKTDAFDPKGNDTTVYYQIFKNYFAFDDGSAEAGYGINGLGSRNAMVAYRFKSYMQDTLRAVNICFNDSYQDANKRTFDLMVWDDDNGTPGNIIYSQEEVMVEQGTRINGFYTYILTDGVAVNDVFYVGWKQRSETFLNAGIDLNTPHNGKQLYWLNGGWNQSQVTGSIMIRPVVGDRIKTTSINDIYYKNSNLITIWPNPARDHISIERGELPVTGKSQVTIFDLSGHELLRVPFSEQIDITSLNNGIYVVITDLNGRRVGFNRLIVTK